MGGCIDDNISALYVAGQLGSDERAAVDAHVDQCSACRMLLGELARQSRRPPGQLGNDEPPLIAAGTMIGRYRVGNVVGAGAMGVVYAAEDQQLGRKVALKLLRPRWSATGARRLVAEAQALARLSHPNVVQVHDAGDWEGRVFVALELVEGETLTAWLSKQRTLPATLDVLRGAGAGLAAAHAAGLVHRDFKPDNVLVGRDGRVRVTDFGLARALDAAVAEERGEPSPSPTSPHVTESGAILGTPAYMSPEQRRGERASAASDQFSFCVVAWEALFGRLPEVQSIVAAAARWPGLPSVPARIRRTVERGLRDDPTARHSSMSALVAELAWDAGARRRLAAGLAIVAALGATVIALGPFRQRACKDGAARFAKVFSPERRAKLASAGATMGEAAGPLADEIRAAWSTFLDNLDHYRDGWVSGYEDACVATHMRGDQSNELLELRMSCLESRLATVDELASVLEHADRATVQRLAATELPPLAACADRAALLAPVPPPRDGATAKRVNALRDEVARANVLNLAGDFRGARARLDPVVDEARKLGYQPLLALALQHRAIVTQQLQEDANAERDYRDSTLAAIAGRDAHTAASTNISAAAFLDDQRNRPKDAVRLCDEAAAFIAQLGGAIDLEARLTSARAGIQETAGKFEEARALNIEALALHQRAPSSSRNNLNMGRAENQLGLIEEHLGHYDQALAALDRALALEKPVLGEHHPMLLQVLNNRLIVLYWVRPNDSLPEATRLLKLHEEAWGLDSAELIHVLDLYANILLVEKKTRPQAPAAAARALAIAIAKRPAGHPDIAQAEGHLAETLFHNKRFADAAPHARAALEAAQKRAVPSEIEQALTMLSEIQIGMGLGREARSNIERAIAMNLKQDDDPRHQAWLEWCHARALAATGEPARARAEAKLAEAGYASRTFPDDELLADVRAFLAKH
jgi:tetratricopeptide (TPR) repeat protein